MSDDLKERLRANALDECDEAVDRIEALEAEIERLREALSNVMGYVDTPVSRRFLRISDPHPEWLVYARAALQDSAE